MQQRWGGLLFFNGVIHTGLARVRIFDLSIHIL